jgi:hypothetical protein
MSIFILTNFFLILNFLLTFIINTNGESVRKNNFIEADNFFYYTRIFEEENDITGTGNKLKDVVYNSICMSLKCKNICCNGLINEMQCGNKNNCKDYWEAASHKEIIDMILIILCPYLLIPLLWGIVNYSINKYPQTHKIFSKILIIYLGVVIPPYGVILIIDHLRIKNDISDPGNLGQELNIFKNNTITANNKVLFEQKEFDIHNFESQEKIREEN